MLSPGAVMRAHPRANGATAIDLLMRSANCHGMYRRQASVRLKNNRDSIPEKSSTVLFLATSSCFLGSKTVGA
jgi:hypothetical protein